MEFLMASKIRRMLLSDSLNRQKLGIRNNGKNSFSDWWWQIMDLKSRLAPLIFLVILRWLSLAISHTLYLPVSLKTIAGKTPSTLRPTLLVAKSHSTMKNTSLLWPKWNKKLNKIWDLVVLEMFQKLWDQLFCPIALTWLQEKMISQVQTKSFEKWDRLFTASYKNQRQQENTKTIYPIIVLWIHRGGIQILGERKAHIKGQTLRTIKNFLRTNMK